MRISNTLPGADTGSDHQLLFANIRVKLKKVETVCREKRWDLGCIGDQYRVETRNRFSELLKSVAEETPGDLWLDLKTTILDSAMTLIRRPFLHKGGKRQLHGFHKK